LGVHVFNFNKNTMFALTLNVAIRMIQEYKRGDFPLPIKLVTGAWLHGYFLTSIGFSQFPSVRHEIMHFGNVVLKYIQNTTGRKLPKTKKRPSIPIVFTNELVLIVFR